jgi:hypothetical protein
MGWPVVGPHAVSTFVPAAGCYWTAQTPPKKGLGLKLSKWLS